jgi:hypothetical protein
LSMGGRLSIIGGVVASVLMLCSLSGCATDAPPQQRPLGSIPTDDLIYDHRAAGFTLAFPPSWHDRYDVDARSGPIAAAQWPYASHAVSFIYRPVEPDQPQLVLLTILVYRRENWNAIAGESGGPPGMSVAEEGDDVYVAAVADSNPFPQGSRDGQNAEAMRLTASQVKDALTLH